MHRNLPVKANSNSFISQSSATWSSYPEQ